MSDSILAIIASECKSACAGEPDLIERCRKSMNAVAKGHWLTSDDDMCFRGAVGGVLLSPETTEEDKTRLTRTIEILRGLGAAMSGVPVDFGALMPESDDFEAVPLMKIWHELKDAK